MLSVLGIADHAWGRAPAGYAVYRQLQGVGWVRAATKRRVPRGGARSVPISCLCYCTLQQQQPGQRLPAPLENQHPNLLLG
jgi:hypothetical protein